MRLVAEWFIIWAFGGDNWGFFFSKEEVKISSKLAVVFKDQTRQLLASGALSGRFEEHLNSATSFFFFFFRSSLFD